MASLQQQQRESDDSNTDCSICLEGLYNGARLSAWKPCGHVFHDACTLEFTRQLEFNPALARCPLCRVDGFDGFLILYLPIPPSMIAQQTLDQLNNDLAERASQLNTREAQLKAKEAKLKTWEQRLEVKQSSGRNNEGKTADQPKQRENASEDVQII